MTLAVAPSTVCALREASAWARPCARSRSRSSCPSGRSRRSASSSRPAPAPYEILSAELAWCDLDSEHPRIERPQGKGDRAGSEETGRTIWLSKRDVALIRSIPRPDGCKYLIPGTAWIAL